jgi:signal recognition particle subunit SRP54
MGNMKDLMGMVPGMRKAMKGVEVDDDSFTPIEAIINSMTPKERANPEILKTSRRQRIAKGSGTSIQDVNKLMKQFEDMRKMMKLMSNKKNMANMMRQMKGMGGKMPS